MTRIDQYLAYFHTPFRARHLTAVTLLVAGVLLAGCEQQPQEAQAPASTANKVSSATAAVPTEQAKTLPPVLLADVQKIIAQAKADDKILVIDFWATWCLPCVQMFPELHEKLPALSDRVRVVTITLDSPGKYEALAVDFLRKHDAMAGAYRIGGEAEQWNEMIAGLGKQWQDLVVPAILIYSPEGVLWDEFINERAKPELILSRVQELVQTSQR